MYLVLHTLRSLIQMLSNILQMYWIQVFEIQLEADVAGYLQPYPAVLRTETRQCDACSIALNADDVHEDVW